MLEQLFAALILHFCSVGQPIDNWYQYTADRDYDLGRVVDTMRMTTDHGPVWVYEFETGVLFVTNPGNEHGQCARKTDGS